MSESVRRRFDRYSAATPNWDAAEDAPMRGFHWIDRLIEDLGPDSDGRLGHLCRRMMTGHYYPVDAIEFYGLWMDEARVIRAGDRILQSARIFPWLRQPVVWAMTEVYIAEVGPDSCKLGYVTTARHFARGTWQAKIERSNGRLSLEVYGRSQSKSWLFWAFLPWARHLQRRAWRRACESLAATP